METGNAAKEERFNLEGIVTVPANLPVATLANGKTRLTIPTQPTDVQVKISGSTVAIVPEIFSVSEGLLKATVSTEVAAPEPEPIGEDSNA